MRMSRFWELTSILGSMIWFLLKYSVVLQRGAMIWLAQNDPAASIDLLQQRMRDKHIDIATTAKISGRIYKM